MLFPLNRDTIRSMLRRASYHDELYFEVAQYLSGLGYRFTMTYGKFNRPVIKPMWRVTFYNHREDSYTKFSEDLRQAIKEAALEVAMYAVSG